MADDAEKDAPEDETPKKPAKRRSTAKKPDKQDEPAKAPTGDAGGETTSDGVKTDSKEAAAAETPTPKDETPAETTAESTENADAAPEEQPATAASDSATDTPTGKPAEGPAEPTASAKAAAAASAAAAKTKEKLEEVDWAYRGNQFVRGIWMVLAGFAAVIAVYLLFLIAFAQWVFAMLTKEELDAAADFNERLAIYIHQLLSYISYKSNDALFPLAPFPDLPEEPNVAEGDDPAQGTDQKAL